ncbi:uncharacterized protein [Magallana gigas]|uniref:uncharacterized protein n=1 Tax=Magallana gigas TaxID=29159 RepID=UPI0033409D10
MPKVKKGQTEGTKGPKNKRKRTEKTRDVGTSSAQAESLSEEVPQMMAPVTLHGNAAPGAPGGLDAAPIPADSWVNGPMMVTWIAAPFGLLLRHSGREGVIVTFNLTIQLILV